MIVVMPDDNHFTLRQIHQASGIYTRSAMEIKALKLQIAGLSSRDYVSRLALIATSALGALIGAVALMITQ
jgi:hypothetical protein